MNTILFSLTKTTSGLLLNKKTDDEVTKMFYLFVNGMNVTAKKSLKKMYEIKSKEEDFIRQFKSVFKAFMKWHEDEQVFALQRNSVFDLWIVFLKLKNDENAKIKDGKLKPFLKHYCKIVGNLLDDKTEFTKEKTCQQSGLCHYDWRQTTWKQYQKA